MIVAADLNSPGTWPRLEAIWYRLMENRKIAARYVYERLLPDEISDADKQNPSVKQELDSRGHFEKAMDLDTKDLAILEALRELGYLEKRRTEFYMTWFDKNVWLCEPVMGPTGILGLSGPTRFSAHSYHLEKEEYERAVEGFKQLKREIDENKHSHIRNLRVAVEYSYETDVYQVLDAFFDAIALVVIAESLKCWLTRPLLETDIDGKPRKNWKRLAELDSSEFLAGGEMVRPRIETLDWKREIIGLIVFDGNGYRLLQSGAAPDPLASEPLRRLQDLQEEFKSIRGRDDATTLNEKFRVLAREIPKLMRECDESSLQTPKCPIRPIFLATTKGRDLSAGLTESFPTSRSGVGDLAESLTKLLWEDSENGKRINQVVLKDVTPLLRIVKELRHHERHDREIGRPGNVEKKFFEIGSFYEMMIGNPIPTMALDWAKIGCCLLIVAHAILQEVLTSIRAIA